MSTWALPFRGVVQGKRREGMCVGWAGRRDQGNAQTICLEFFWKCRESQRTERVIPACWLLSSAQVQESNSRFQDSCPRAPCEPGTSPGKTKLPHSKEVVSNVLLPFPPTSTLIHFHVPMFTLGSVCRSVNSVPTATWRHRPLSTVA